MYTTESNQPEYHAAQPHAPQPHASESPNSPETSDAAEPLPIAARIINSKSLFGEARIIHIEHRGMIYRMSITNQNRLILQK